MDALLYPLSQIFIVCDYRPPAPPSPNRPKMPVTSQLKLRNFLSLLLVQIKKGDVATVTLRLLPQSTILYFAKQRPCIGGEKSYIDSLFAQVLAWPAARTSSPEANTRSHHAFLTTVIRNCRPKINSRIARLITRLGELGADFSISCIAANVALTENYLRDNIDNHLFLPK